MWKHSKHWSNDVFPNINRTQATEIDLDLQTVPSEGWNTCSMWISCKSVQQFPRYPLKTPFLSVVTLTFDLDIQTHLSEGPNTSFLQIWHVSVQQFPGYFIHKQKSHRQHQKQNLTHFTAFRFAVMMFFCRITIMLYVAVYWLLYWLTSISVKCWWHFHAGPVVFLIDIFDLCESYLLNCGYFATYQILV